ncbi:hypothetical protein SERLA73DRAFT_192168 [Serpula lacrymans var. lacrymans S7.3]|uniref:Uncharacterized protein n=1 Tax=Serpula lacrymans var. lacrymans (strain S7.3) TaxID=936435 RepID=F8QJ62_SERL3|nr:hypothetical protein SERLA73DRAFT_192168 [Serpula lacrymans var. lacrymans S7.3]
MVSWEDAVKKGKAKHYQYQHSSFIVSQALKIKNNRTVNECSAEEKETGATGPPPSQNPTVPWPYQWTGCVGPPGQTREGEE